MSAEKSRCFRPHNRLMTLELAENRGNSVNCCSQSLASLGDLPPESSSAQTLYARNVSVSSLAGIPVMDFLHTLDISLNEISDFSLLTDNAPALKRLLVDDNQLEYCGHLPELKDIEHLSLSGNPLESLEGCPDYPKLKSLCLSRTNFSSFEGMPVFSQLRTLHLAETPIARVLGQHARVFAVAVIPSLQIVDRIKVTEYDRTRARKLPASILVTARLGFVPSSEACAQGLDAIAVEATEYEETAKSVGNQTLEVSGFDGAPVEGVELCSSHQETTWERWPREGDPLVLTMGQRYTPVLEDVGCLIVARHTSGGVHVLPPSQLCAPTVVSATLIADCNGVQSVEHAELVEGGILRVKLEYMGGQPGQHLFSWLMRRGEETEVFATTKEPMTRLSYEQVDCVVGCRVTPVRSDGVLGDSFAIFTEQTVIPALPTALDFTVEAMSGEWVQNDVVTASYGFCGGLRGDCSLTWYRGQVEPDNEIIASRDHDTMRLTPEDVGHSITVLLTPANTDGVTGSVASFVSPIVKPAYPGVSAVAIASSEGVKEGVGLSVSYTYTGGTEGETLIQWCRCGSPEAELVPIDGATGATYVPVSEDVGSYIAVKVKPVRDDGAVGHGAKAVTSSAVASSPPTCSDLSLQPMEPLSGVAVAAVYTYIGPQPETSRVTWTRVREDGEDELLAGLVAEIGYQYTPTPEDVGCRLRVTLVPEGAGLVGAAVTAVTEPVAALPEFRSVRVEGEAKVDAALAVACEYEGPEPEGESVFVWECAEDNGETRRLPETGRQLQLDAELLGLRVRCVATPVDAKGLQGPAVTADWVGPVGEAGPDPVEVFAQKLRDFNAVINGVSFATAAGTLVDAVEPSAVLIPHLELAPIDAKLPLRESPCDELIACATYTWTCGEATSTEYSFTVPAESAGQTVALTVTFPTASFDCSAMIRLLPRLEGATDSTVSTLPSGHLSAQWTGFSGAERVTLRIERQTGDQWTPVEDELPEVSATGFTMQLSYADLGHAYRYTLTPIGADGTEGPEFNANSGQICVDTQYKSTVDAQLAAGQAELPAEFNSKPVSLCLTAKEVKVVSAQGKALQKCALGKVMSPAVERSAPSRLPVSGSCVLDFPSAIECSSAAIYIQAFKDHASGSK